MGAGSVQAVHQKGVKVIVYEPTLPNGDEFFGSLAVNDLEESKRRSDVIIADRRDSSSDAAVTGFLPAFPWESSCEPSFPDSIFSAMRAS